ncbi:hypothetical protein BO94DRAFT_539011 [Aspergillus sclerotioniger CBS 115572]|uniref:Thioesterase/thiol ester dehydrase-isomerase n=1 Tax=Aspergillus sclerotioniger CBS 115572 TaxID=1450535 RepID=A0A317VFH1_9EURO|nr:hypothetical protein BO94DRAFT_539011 [Aspergillus sclerotioniger CBS 115572]PWY73133.1 hypothetical protein BO94DRAFT_539011 [Aspergillus sclerotioniger CBS 115572]
MADVLSTLRETLPSLLSWKALALVLAILSFKNLPGVWHIRLGYHLFINLRRHPTDAPFPTCPPSTNSSSSTKSIKSHPIFAPHSLTTHTSLWETDYNIHKSNSTYFSDLDISRTAIVTRVYTPGVTLISKQLDTELAKVSKEQGRENVGKKIYIALGSTYTSFKREIKPFEGYKVVSRVVGWDRKWVYILSLFVSGKGGKGKVFATAVSKYVVKKGWLTVHPERVLRASGLYPDVPIAEGITNKDKDGEGEGEEGVVLVEEGEGLETPEGIKENVAVDGGVVGEVLDKVKHGKAWDRNEWTWEQIEEERLRGLKVVEGYVGLDEKLLAEWEE